jgi:SAM-dependent methyltransferase
MSLLKNNSKKNILSWKKFWKLKKVKLASYNNRLLLNQNGMGEGPGYISLRNYKKSQKEVYKILKILPYESILDYGSGNGLFASYFIKKVNKVYCYDLSGISMDIGKLRFKEIFFLKKCDIKNKYDHVICSSVFQYLSYKEAMKLLIFFNQISKKSFFIVDISSLATKKEHLKFRKKFILNSKYSLPNHTYFNKDFFINFAKKNSLSISFFNNVLLHRQKKFRFSVLLKKE